jgi:hypothetical protein
LKEAAPEDYHKARIYFPDGRVLRYSDPAQAHRIYQKLKPYARCAFRAVADNTPVRDEDYARRSPHDSLSHVR